MLSTKPVPAVGEMRERIEFQSLTETPDGQGGATESWVTFWQCWAAIKISRGGESNFAEQIRVTYDRDIFIRRKDGLNTNMRVIFRGRNWQVKAIEYLDEEQFFQKISVIENVGS
jgi:SPP1 family predicted phage head-tail adaptor